MALLAAPVVAQLDPIPVEPPRGIFAASPLALLFQDSSNTPGGASNLHFKPAGAGAPTPLTNQFPAPSVATPNVPDYRAASLEAALTAALGVTLPPGVFEIDAISTGNDRTPARWDEAAGEFVFDPAANGQWSAAMFSVAHTAAPRPAGGWLGFRAGQLPGGPGLGAELIGTYAPGSTPAIPVPGESYLEQGAGDFQPGTFPSPNGRPEIVGLDVFIPFILGGLGEPDPVLMPVTGQLYLSLTRDCAAAIDAQLPSLGGNPVTVTGATIFRLSWNPSSLTWGSVYVAASHTDLGLAVDDDVDALAVGSALAGSAGNVNGAAFMFSLRRVPASTNSLLPQLLMWAPSVVLPSGITAPRRGEPVDSNRLRLPAGADITLEDDIDAICNPDPERGPELPLILGLPTFRMMVPASQGRIGLSMSRDYANDVLHCVVSGRRGVDPRNPPTAAMAVVFELPNLFPGVEFQHVVPVLRRPRDHTFQFTSPLPPPGSEMLCHVMQRSADGTVQRSWPLEISF